MHSLLYAGCFFLTRFALLVLSLTQILGNEDCNFKCTHTGRSQCKNETATNTRKKGRIKNNNNNSSESKWWKRPNYDYAVDSSTILRVRVDIRSTRFFLLTHRKPSLNHYMRDRSGLDVECGAGLRYEARKLVQIHWNMTKLYVFFIIYRKMGRKVDCGLIMDKTLE